MAATAQLRELEKSALVKSALRSGSSVRLRVFGSSMLPSLWPGDVVAVERPSDIRFSAGDIALALHESGFRLHRLVAVGEQCVTRGDALPQDDPPVDFNDLLGRVVSVERNGCSFMPPRITLVTRALGRIFCHCDPVRNLALRIRSARLSRRERNIPVWSPENA